MEERGAPRALRTVVWLGLIAGSLSVGPPAGVEAAKKAKPVVIEGTLIDTKCYSLDRANTGDDHQTKDGTIEGCAAACAQLGIPVAVLTGKDDPTILIAPATELAEFMGRQVRVTGSKAFRGSAMRAETIEVRDADGAWKSIEFHTMM